MTDHDIWKKEFKQLHAEIDGALKIFAENRTCACKRTECKHWKRKRNKVFGKRIDDLHDRKMQISFAAFIRIRSDE